jgi:hypothetical protein
VRHSVLRRQRYLYSRRCNRLGSIYALHVPRSNPTNALVILTGGARFAGAEGSLCYGFEIWKGTGARVGIPHFRSIISLFYYITGRDKTNVTKMKEGMDHGITGSCVPWIGNA